MAAAVKTVVTLAGLLVVLPLNLALTAAALLRGRARKPATAPPAAAQSPRKTILISGAKMTKALHLARAFDRAGHRVVLVESHRYRFTGHRFSRAVSAFYAIPKPEDAGYAAALVDVVRREGVDVYVPVCSPGSAQPDAAAKAALEAFCEVLHFDPATVVTLDDKTRFCAAAAELGLSVPDFHRITDPRQVTEFDFAAGAPPYILKSVPYDPIGRLDLTRLPRDTPEETAAFVAGLPISEAHPWIMQSFVTGQEYCTHATVRDGTVQVHLCCESSAFQINYAMVDKPEIEAWVRRFVAGLNLTGQASFDFIEAEDGRVYAIECNPRTHSAITLLYDHPGVARAYLETGVPEVRPLPGSRPTHWLYHEVWRLIAEPGRRRRLRSIARGKDAIFDWADPLPFLMVHHLQIPWLLVENLRAGRGWIRIDFNIGKLVEPAGD